jgi:hypothetical protein
VEKEKVIRWMVERKINTVDEVGRIVAEYYLNHDSLLKSIR